MIAKRRAMVALGLAALVAVAASACGGGSSAHAAAQLTTDVAAAPTAAPPPPAPDAVVGLENRFVQVIDTVSPSVVQIETSDGLGSGVVFYRNGDIVTNA